MNDEPTKRHDAPVAGAFTEGATTIMNDEQRRQALAAAGVSFDPPQQTAPAPQSIHDEPTRQANDFSIGLDIDPPHGQSPMSFEQPSGATFELPPPGDASMGFEPPQQQASVGFETPAPQPMGFEQSGPRVPADSYNEPALGPEGNLPSHLQLPSIDFSLPQGVGDASFGGSSGGSPAAELPAHLQLPNFPEFDLPSVPGVEQTKRRLTDDVGIEGNLGGSFGALDAPAAPMPAAGSSDGWAVAPATGATIPPPPPKRTAGAKRPANVPGVGMPGDLPNLPAMSLPSVGAPAQKKEPTLLRSDVAEKLATVKKKSMVGPIIAITLLIVSAGSALYVYKDIIITRVFGKHQDAAVETNTDKARKLVALGTTFYDGNQMPQAIETFEQALAIDPTYAKAHRSLAIAFAKMNMPDKAVTHYRTYLVLAPTAEDAPAVKKIVDDYDLKAKEQAAKAAEEAKAKAKHK